MDMVVIDIEGVIGAAISEAKAEEMVSRGVSMGISVLASREVGLVTITEEVGSTVSVGELELLFSTSQK